MIRESFRKYLEEAIGRDNALVAFSAFDTPASVAVRRNPFKKGKTPEGRPVPWNSYGSILPERPSFTLDPHFHGGAYYVQDSSSMFVGHIFRSLLDKVSLPEHRPVRVLDLCAAPGGKTTDLATSLREAFGNRFLLVSNEVMKQRAGVLADNVAIWGDPNVVVTSDDPSAFASLPGFFDIIVADVPCSGEGMFRKDEEARSQWSEDTVALCAARQRRIIADVWPALASDGLFIYSTCTFNTYENDGNVVWTARELEAVPLTETLLPEGCAAADCQEFPGVLKTRYGYSLVPGSVEGEGQYCSALRKKSDVMSSGCDRKYGKMKPGKTGKEAMPAVQDIVKLLSEEVSFRMKGELVTAVPQTVAGDVAVVCSCMHVLSAGTAVGMFKGRNFIPDADLALSLLLADDAFPRAEVDRNVALAYLHRDAIVLPDAPTGYVLVCHEGLPLGFVKNLGNRCNSLHPQSRRIRMDITTSCSCKNF